MENNDTMEKTVFIKTETKKEECLEEIQEKTKGNLILIKKK